MRHIMMHLRIGWDRFSRMPVGAVLFEAAAFFALVIGLLFLVIMQESSGWK